MKILISKFFLLAVAISFTGLTQESLGQSVASKIETLGVPDHIKVEEIRAVKRNGLLTVQASIVNLDTSSQTMRYRFRWIDVQGFDVGAEEAWKPLILHGQQNQRIQTVAPVPTAMDFILQIHADENTVR